MTFGITGWIEDATGNWDSSFRFAGACNLLAGLILLLEPLINRIWCCSEKQTPEDEEVPPVEPPNDEEVPPVELPKDEEVHPVKDTNVLPD